MSEKITYPFGYRAFSLNILSQLPVIGFESAKIEKAEVYIYEDQVPESLHKIVNKGVLYQSNETEFLFRLDNVAAYYIRNGREIAIQRFSNASDDEISAFLTGTAFGALLHQRHLLPLHASSVIFNDECLVFAGLSGAGKSTLALALINAGGILLSDDISVIDFSGNKPAVCPAFPFIKIWEDSLKHLGISSTGLKPVRSDLKKYYIPVSKFSHVCTAIRHIYILSNHNQKEVQIQPLRGVDKFIVMKKHTFMFRGIPQTGLEKNHFLLANQLADQVPVTILKRPGGEFNTEKLLQIIVGNL